MHCPTEDKNEQENHSVLENNSQDNNQASLPKKEPLSDQLTPEEELALKEFISAAEWEKASITTKLTLAIETGLSELLVRLWPVSNKNNERIVLTNKDKNHAISLLCYAYIKGDITIIETLTNLGATFCQDDWRFNLNLLDLVVAQGHSHMINYILQNESNPKKIEFFLFNYSNHGFTPLATAAEFGYIECLEELLKAARSESEKEKLLAQRTSKSNRTALDLAIMYNHTNCVKLLLAHDKRTDFSSALLNAAIEEESAASIDILNLLLSHIDNNKNFITHCNEAQEKKVTPLHKLIENGKTESALTLLSLIKEMQALSTLNIQDEDQQYAPLHIAILLKNKKISEELLAIKEVNVNLLTENNTYTLFDCALSNYPEILPALLKRKDIKFGLTGKKGVSSLLKALSLESENLTEAFYLLESQKERVSELSDEDKKQLIMEKFIFSDDQIIDALIECYRLFALIKDTIKNNNKREKIGIFIEKALELIPQELIDTLLRKKITYDNQAILGKKNYEKWLKTRKSFTKKSDAADSKKAEQLAAELCLQEEQEKAIKARKNSKNKKRKKTQETSFAKPSESRQLTTTTKTLRTTDDTTRKTSSTADNLARQIEMLTIDDQAQDFVPVKTKTRKKKTPTLETIPDLIRDEKIFSSGQAHLYLNKQNMKKNNNTLHTAYLKNYEYAPRVQKQQEKFHDYHTFTTEVENFWAPYATSKEEDLETRLSDNLFDMYGVYYVKIIKYKIHGFINNTAGSFEFILLIPSEAYLAEHKPLCIHRFFAPQFSLSPVCRTTR